MRSGKSPFKTSEQSGQGLTIRFGISFQFFIDCYFKKTKLILDEKLKIVSAKLKEEFAKYFKAFFSLYRQEKMF